MLTVSLLTVTLIAMMLTVLMPMRLPMKRLVNWWWLLYRLLMNSACRLLVSISALMLLLLGEGKGNGIAIHGTPSHSYGVSLAIWDHTVLPAIWHKWSQPLFSPASKAGTRFTYPGGMEGWVDLDDLFVTYQDGLPACRRSPIQVLTGPGVD